MFVSVAKSKLKIGVKLPVSLEKDERTELLIFSHRFSNYRAA